MAEGLSRITVVTPSYQQGWALERCISSVLDQGYPDLEYFVLDGGSSDSSRSVLEAFDDRIDWWYSHPDGGQTSALREGFARATGEVLCWVNSDDWLLPGALHDVGSLMRDRHDVRFVYGDVVVEDRSGRVIRTRRETSFDWLTWLWRYNYIPQSSAFWRRSLYEEAGGIDVTFDLAMDADLWERMARISKPVHVPSVWSGICVYPEQKNQSLRARSDAEDTRIRERHLGRQPGWPEVCARRTAALVLRAVKRAGRMAARAIGS